MFVTSCSLDNLHGTDAATRVYESGRFIINLEVSWGTQKVVSVRRRERIYRRDRGNNRKGKCNKLQMRVRNKSRETGKLGWGGEESRQEQVMWSGLNGVAHLLHLSHIIFGTPKA